MDEDKVVQELLELVEALAVDCNRFSTSGKETYDKICSLMNILAYGM